MIERRLRITILSCSWFLLAITAVTVADETIYRFEGDVLPYSDMAGWEVFDACEYPCTEWSANGYFVQQWPTSTDQTSYHFWIAREGDPVPPALWAEWQFRSDHPFGGMFVSCDAYFYFRYKGVLDSIFMYGDAVITFSLANLWADLNLNEFHTFRFESIDGEYYTISVDGRIIDSGLDDTPSPVAFLQFGGTGGCGSGNTTNEWDFIRYGTVEVGEQVIESAPQSGVLNPLDRSTLDRINMTFDAANYLYVDEVTVTSSIEPAPKVIATRRPVNGEPDTIEIVLNRPIPLHGTTRIIMDDGTITNTIDYEFATGDADADGDTDDTDYSILYRCLAGPGTTLARPICLNSDLTLDKSIDLSDVAALQLMFTGIE